MYLAATALVKSPLDWTVWVLGFVTKRGMIAEMRTQLEHQVKISLFCFFRSCLFSFHSGSDFVLGLNRSVSKGRIIKYVGSHGHSFKNEAFAE